MVVKISPELPSSYLTPTGSEGKALENLRKQLAASSAFQTLAGLSAADALEKIFYKALDPVFVWAASRPAKRFRFVEPVDGAEGLIFECTTAGTTGAAEPTWPTTADTTVTDGDVVWTSRAEISEFGNSVDRYTRPFAIVTIDDSTDEPVGVSGSVSYIKRLELMFAVIADVPADYAYSFESGGMWIENLANEIIKDVNALSGTPGYLNAQNVKRENVDISPVDELDSMGIFGEAVFAIECWGL